MGRIFSLTGAPRASAQCNVAHQLRRRLLAMMARLLLAAVAVLLCTGPSARGRGTRRARKRSPQASSKTWADMAAGNVDIRGPVIEHPKRRHSKIVYVAGTPCAHRDSALKTSAAAPIASS